MIIMNPMHVGKYNFLALQNTHSTTLDSCFDNRSSVPGRCALPVLPCALSDYPAPCPNSIKKKILIIFSIFYLFTILLFLCFQTADVKMLVTACRCVPMFSSIAHKMVPRPCFICALNCARILVVRALDCAQFLLHPALFPT